MMNLPEGTTAKGTTILGFLFDGGIILSGDSRITNIDGDVIISDNERKYFELCSARPIMCTFTGSVSDWYGLYQYVRKKKPTTVNEASVLAEDYMVKYSDKYRVLLAKRKKEYGESVTFGTLIAGYDEKQVYQLYSVSLDDNNMPSRKKLDLATLGTGAELAENVFPKARNWLTIHSATELAYKALLHCTYFDKSAGGTLYVLHLNKNNCNVAHSSVLDVNYLYFGSFDVDQRSLFLLYSKKIDPITKHGDLRKVMNSIWPGGEVDGGDLQAAHLVAQNQKGCCFHRFVFKTVEMASNAYNCIPLNQNTGTTPALEDLVAKESFRRCDHNGHLLYVGESSKIALGRICKMME